MRLLLLAALPLLLWRPDPLAPGDPALDPSRVSAGTDSLLVLVQQGDQLGYGGLMVLQTWTGGDRPISRRERILGPDGLEVSVDSFALDARTLAPVYRVVAGEARTAPGEAFHPNSVDLVLAALPLAEGFSAELALDSTGTDLASVASVRVLGVEDVELVSRARCPSWKVEVRIGDRPGIYLINQATRTLMRYVSPQEGLLLTSAARSCSG